MGAPSGKRRRPSGTVERILAGLSVKSRRLLVERGVPAAFRSGRSLAVLGRPARLAADGPFARLAFRLGEDGRLSVGFAVADDVDGPWHEERGEFEPFTSRAYGYYVRYLKRLPPVD